MSARKAPSALQRLGKLLDEAGLTVDFDMLRDTTIGCTEKCSAWAGGVQGRIWELPSEGMCKAHMAGLIVAEMAIEAAARAVEACEPAEHVTDKLKFKFTRAVFARRVRQLASAQQPPRTTPRRGA